MCVCVFLTLCKIFDSLSCQGLLVWDRETSPASFSQSWPLVTQNFVRFVSGRHGWEIKCRAMKVSGKLNAGLKAHSTWPTHVCINWISKKCSVLRLALDYSTLIKGSNVIKGNVWKTLQGCTKERWDLYYYFEGTENSGTKPKTKEQNKNKQILTGDV